MIARRSVWSDARVQELARQFVPVADEVGRLQRGEDAECTMFQRFCEEGHYGGRTKPTPTRQGIYACTPSGKFLASCNTRRPQHALRMLEKALARWDELADRDKALSREDARRLTAVKRWEDRYPEDGLVLRVTSRDLPGARARARWHKHAWNVDHAWFSKAEALSFLPGEIEPGATCLAPKALARRIARCHLVDNVRGQTPAFAGQDVRHAELRTRVESVDGDRVAVALDGRTETAHEGKWARGVETTLLGRAVFDRAKERFECFELVAIGTRWGRTRYNSRDDTPERVREPIGFALTLAPAGPESRVAPASIWHYGWR